MSQIEPGETLHFYMENSPEVVVRQMLKDQERIKELEETNARLLQDRLDYSSVLTTEGMNASEWIWRTGMAERKVRELEQRLELVRIACVHAESPYGNEHVRASLLRRAIGPNPELAL